MTRTIRRTAALTAATALCVAGAATPAHAISAHHAGSAKSGSGSFGFVIGGSEKHQLAVLHGAISGGGKDVAKGQADTVQLAGGDLVVKHPDSQSHFTPHVDPTTCYATFTVTGKFTLGGGTGSYAGASGSGTYLTKGYAVLKRTSAGSCDMHGAPQVEVFTVYGHGTLA